ncbi:MAG: V-type ATP synthase subunit F [Firmicutes bacterium]|jgi:V/A-type H+-transporting ATPase subunit F|nr:V-type ATP synthase subunit F [Bacillota bacterium]
MVMYKIAVVGEERAVLGFRSLGADIFVLSRPEEGQEIAVSLQKNRYGVVFFTEQAAETVPELVEIFDDQPLPAVAIIPGVEGSKGLARARMKKIVEKAVGADILFQERG